MIKLQRDLHEQIYRAIMVKGKHVWIDKGMLFSTLALGAISFSSIDVHADIWTAATNEEIATRVKAEDGQYTFREGGTFWAIGNAVNTNPSKLMELNGFGEGSQYSVPIGTTVHWDGNHVTVKDADGNIVSDSIIKDEDKVNPNATIANQASDTPKKPVTVDGNGNVIGNNNTNVNNTNNNNANINNIIIFKEHRSQGIGTFLIPQTCDAKSLGEIGDVYTDKLLGRAKENTWNYYDSTQSITKYLKYSTENKGLFFKTGSGLQLKNGRKEERLGDWVKINMNYFDFDDIAKNSTRSFDNTQLLEDIENTTIEIVENGLSMFDLDNQEENDTNISTSYISELSDADK